jgi:aryl-alcohol dehydrogenase-like predicted oxidoreductase
MGSRAVPPGSWAPDPDPDPDLDPDLDLDLDLDRCAILLPMEYRSLGTSGLKVPVLCLGAMTFGEADDKSFMHKVGCDEKTSFAIMSRALERGVGFIDTADVYGQDGLSERIVGAWMAEAKSRDRVVLATKFRFRMGEGPNGTGASRYRIVRAVEESLRRLGTDRIDLYQIHMQDIDTPEEETLRALDDLVHAGKVLYLGASNYAAYRLTDSQWISRTEHLHRFVALQMQYSLMVRDLEREHVPVCKQFGLGILPWSPLAAGFLSGKYVKNQPPPPGLRLDKWKERFADFDSDRGWRTIDAVQAIAKERSTTAAAVSLAWLLAKPTVTSVIFGARSLEQLDDNLKAVDVKLSAADVQKLDDASAFELGYPYEFIANIQKRW